MVLFQNGRGVIGIFSNWSFLNVSIKNKSMYKCDREIQMKIDSCFSKAEILIHIHYLKFIVTAVGGLKMSLMVFFRITVRSLLLHPTIDVRRFNRHFTQHLYPSTEVCGFSHPNACKKQDEGKRYGNGLFQCCKNTVF